jgi:hypothetical protein
MRLERRLVVVLLVEKERGGVGGVGVQDVGLAARAISSVGRAPPRQGGGHWFEPSIAHSDSPESVRTERRLLGGVRRSGPRLVDVSEDMMSSCIIGGCLG